MLSCSNSPSWPSRSRGLVSVVTHTTHGARCLRWNTQLTESDACVQNTLHNVPVAGKVRFDLMRHCASDVVGPAVQTSTGTTRTPFHGIAAQPQGREGQSRAHSYVRVPSHGPSDRCGRQKQEPETRAGHIPCAAGAQAVRAEGGGHTPADSMSSCIGLNPVLGTESVDASGAVPASLPCCPAGPRALAPRLRHGWNLHAPPLQLTQSPD